VEAGLSGIQDALATAKRNHRAGDLGRAEEAYRLVLRDAPENGEVWYYLGAICLSLGRNDEAATHLREATRLCPEDFSGHDLLGIVLARQEDGAGAEACFRRALALKPDHAETHYNLGKTLGDRGVLAEAESHHREALRLKPDFFDAIVGLAFFLIKQGKFAAASDQIRKAAALRPVPPKIYSYLGDELLKKGRYSEAEPQYREVVRIQPDSLEGHISLGVTLHHLGRYEQAAACYREAIRLKPDSPLPHSNLGATLSTLGRKAEAQSSYQEALRLGPNVAETHLNVGALLADEGDLDGADERFRRALELKPDLGEAHYSRGALLFRCGRPVEALVHFERALTFEPEHLESHKCRGMARLSLGDFQGGWPDYDWRLKLPRYAWLNLPCPIWDGAPLGGKTILVVADQGLGDTLQMIRYAPLLRDRGARVVVACQLSLMPMLAHFPGVDRLVPQGEIVSNADVFVPMMSLPGRFGTTVESIPADVPYLVADPELVAHWRGELGRHEGLRVGIVWQGNREQAEDRRRSFPLTCFEPLARVPGVQLFSLQKGFGSEQLDSEHVGFPVIDLGRTLDERTGAFVETAAVLKNLDLVVTADTAMAHLAGALGVPVWVALSHAADFRWLRDREDSPWYL
jgi:tetratricopeptide (TPR) repeat protein